MTDGRNLNILQSGRQMLRAFGGVNETYGCSEAELSSSLNFSARGYPALQTRMMRRKVQEVQDVNGMYHLNGLLICKGTTLEYTPDSTDAREGAVVLKGAVTDNEKTMTGMGTKILIWPDKKAFDISTGKLEDLAAKWALGDESMTVTPCDGEGKTYTPDSVGTEEPGSPADGQLFLKGSTEEPYGAGSVLLKYSAKNKKWTEILLQSLRLHCPGLGSVLKEGDTVTLSGMPGAVCDALAAGLNGEVSIGTLDGDDMVVTLVPQEDSSRYYGSWTVTATGMTWNSADGKVTENESATAPVTAQRRVPDLDWLTEHNNRVWGCSSTENVIYACKLGDATNWFSYRGTAADSYAVTVGSDGAFTGAATCMGYVLFFKENGLHKLYGTKPSDYQMSSIQCSGVAKGAHQSLCVINETLYYLSMDGVMAWDGSLPTKVSASLDETAMSRVTRAAAGGLVGRYYLHTESPGGQRLLVYDTEKGLWHEEDATGWAMCSTGRQLYLWDKEAIWAADGSREAGGEEDTVEYEAVTGDIGLGDPDDKYCSRVTVRLDAMERTVVTLWASFDGGEWEEKGRVDTRDRRVQVNLPFVPTRHDTMRLRLTGKGQIAVRSIAMTLSSSEGGRVSGAMPKR